MVLLKGDISRIARFKFERNTPRSVHCYRPTFGLSLERVKIPARDIHVRGYFGFIKRVENSQATTVLIRAHLSACSSLEEFSKALMRPCPDHCSLCNRICDTMSIWVDWTKYADGAVGADAELSHIERVRRSFGEPVLRLRTPCRCWDSYHGFWLTPASAGWFNPGPAPTVGLLPGKNALAVMAPGIFRTVNRIIAEHRHLS